MRPVRWSETVDLMIKPGEIVTLKSPIDALEFLDGPWPGDPGPRHAAARRFCRAAIAGNKSSEDARKVFIEAAQEANLKPR
ncbi:DUF982 domain-containing protein [Rhizobium tubonense]|uniref:DUF982 domain-containing protein n=1 Tax=Rhizobium tubonense TaxID=484088 RepID=A0A2W4C898_9HYPH|nr:DUF982 domain-containing protein [Rhizobium tubonense]PZM07355.1 hypothetical protein CPY51_31890 [Rhizobium tubonense]